MKRIHNMLVFGLLVLVICASLSSLIYTFMLYDKEARQLGLVGKSIGKVDFCINTPPAINMSDCPTNTTQWQNYSCGISAYDPDIISFSYSSLMVVTNRTYPSYYQPPGLLNFTPTSLGRINFTTNNDDVGNYIINIMVNDGMGCHNGASTQQFELTVLNVNDGPYLIQNIPEQVYEAGVSLHAFFLNNFFGDLELDPLAYTVTGNNVPEITIDILNSSEVVIRSEICDLAEYVWFTATDPSNATNISNAVLIKCVSAQVNPESNAGSGTGGGSGGGSSFPCRSEYECFDYHKCNISNVKLIRCVDKKGCGPEKILQVPCIYEPPFFCNESWNCSEWSPCLPNGTQTRYCYDINECPTRLKMPFMIQSCEYIGTCNDSLKNCHDGSCEEGIDCGGPCSACKSIQVPYPFPEEKGIGVYIITGLILLLLMAVLVYHYFRKEINSALAKAGWYLSRKKKKQILLTREEKKKLLSELSEIEKKASVESGQGLFLLLNRYYQSLVFYYQCSCAIAKGGEFDLAQLPGIMDKKKRRLVPILRKIFGQLSAKYLKLAHNESMVSKLSMKLLIEELRNLVIQTSASEPGELDIEEKEIRAADNDDSITKAVTLIINNYIALEFVEIDVSKKKYLELTEMYEKLAIKDQELIYDDMALLYSNISYVNSWAGNA